MVLSSLAAAPFVTHALVDPSPVDGASEVVRAVGTYVYRVFVVLIVAGLLFARRTGGVISWRRVCFCVLLGASFVAAWVDGVTDDEFTTGLTTFAGGASVLALGMTLVLVAPTYGFEAWWVWRRRRQERDRDPEGYAAARISEVLAHLEKGIPAEPKELRETLDSFEEAALAIEVGVGRRARVREPATAEWLSRHTRARADAIRDLRRAVCLPQDDTLNLVRSRLEEARSCIASGSWGELPESVAPPPSTESFLVRAGRAARELVVGLLPLAAVAALEATVGLEGGWATGAWTFSTGLALVTVLLLLDPRLAEKLSLTKGLRDAYR
jgi:hypothetical protein